MIKLIRPASVLAVTLLFSAQLWAGGPTPADTVRRFYTWYVQELKMGVKPLERERSEMRRFVTDRLLQRIDDARKSSAPRDPFLNAREIDADWGTNVAVDNIFVGRIARVSVTLSGHRLGDRQMELKLVQENGVWKIDEISFN